MKKLLILIGISGAGKSTFSQPLKDFTRINRDDIRKMTFQLDNYYSTPGIKEREKIVDKIEDNILEILLEEKKNIVIDNTNLNIKYIAKYTEIAKKYNYNLELKFFDISLEDAQERVKNRENTENVEYIKNQYYNYLNLKKLL